MQRATTNSRTKAIVQPSPHRRKLAASSAVAGAVFLALAGTYVITTNQAAASLQPATPTQTAGFAGPPSFAEIAARVTPAVVNVAVTQNGLTDAHPKMELPQLPDGTPFGDFFERFFHQGSPFAQGFDIPRETHGQGSGFIIDPEGHIVTNNHVIANATEVKVVLNDGTDYRARVVGRDSRTDLALLKVDAEKPLPYVELGSSDQARVGDWVLAVGNPFGLGGSVSAGIVSARGRDIHSGPSDDYLQIDAPINRGNSGGPLFDAAGRVIGVNTAIYSPSGGNVGIGFAIPSARAEQVIADLKDHGRVERGWLGVQIQPVTDEIAAALNRHDRQGALVAEVMEDTPAAKAGLRPGDLILSVNATPVEEVRDLSQMVAGIQPGTKARIAIQRDGAERNLKLIIGEMPAEERVATAPASDDKHAEPRLGLYLAPLTDDVREAQGLEDGTKGVMVSRVEQGSAAEKAGIRPGTLITMVGSRQVSTPDEAATSVREALSHGEGAVLLRVEQKGHTRFIAVEPAA
jgi:serine protease Do